MQPRSKEVEMLRRGIVFLLGLMVAAMLASSGGAKPTLEMPTLKGIFVNVDGPAATIKAGGGVRYTIGTGTNRRAGVKGVKVRVWLPGVRILRMQLPVDRTFNITHNIVRAPGGFIMTFSRLPAGFGFSAIIDAKVRLPAGSKPCDKAVLTIATGKSATYKFPCYTVVR